MATVKIKNPITGEEIEYINPFTYDAGANAWVVSDVTEITDVHFNNLLRFGQPYNPNHILEPNRKLS